MPSGDPYLTEVYDQLHETPMQRKIRRLAPVPLGVVFIQWPDMDLDDIRQQFQLMKRLGVTALKGVHVAEDIRREVMHMALDEGLIPWWYGQGGWEEITDELCQKLGLDPSLPLAELREHPKMVEYQTAKLHERVDRECDRLEEGHRLGKLSSESPAALFTPDVTLLPDAIPAFVEWLKETYGSAQAVVEAWNMTNHMIARSLPSSWEDVEAFLDKQVRDTRSMQTLYIPAHREYRRIRDMIRFKADLYLKGMAERVQQFHAAEPDAPFRAGGEMGLFLPFASRATDMEGIAGVMAQGGSFYPSIHLAWHFEEVQYEVPRPVYLQASTMADWFKGGWSGPWESTGGPQQLSGGKANLYPQAKNTWPGSTVDAGVMTQLMLSYLAAGFRGFGLWCWNARTAGWEAGEFALLGRNLEVTERAEKVGRIGQACQKYRDEIWAARKEPLVGIFMDFDNDAIWTAASVGGREFYKRVPVFARLGAGRAMINQNVPFEFVSATDLRKGLAGRYPVIFLPAVLALAEDIQDILLEYARNGGRVVMDMPSAWYDTYGRMLPTAPASRFEQLFGCSIRDFQYSRNVPWRYRGRVLEGFTAELGLTTAAVAEPFEVTGLPAVTENAVGSGSAAVMVWEAALRCKDPGNVEAEADLVRVALAGREAPFTCDGAIAYRRSAPAADHYFLINDDEARTATLTTKPTYASATDAVTGEPIDLSKPIDLPRYSGRWIRAARSGA